MAIILKILMKNIPTPGYNLGVGIDQFSLIIWKFPWQLWRGIKKSKW